MLLWYLLATFLQIILAFYITCLALAFLTGAPFVPSSQKAAQAMIRLAKIKPGMKVYDLGSGDGRLLMLAAQAGAARATGYEINPFLVLFVRLRALFSPYRKVIKVYWRSFWRAQIADADIVFVYLLPWKMDHLQRMLVSQLKTGALIVSNSFIFKEWNINRHDPEAHVYVFQIPSYQPLTNAKKKLQ